MNLHVIKLASSHIPVPRYGNVLIVTGKPVESHVFPSSAMKGEAALGRKALLSHLLTMGTRKRTPSVQPERRVDASLRVTSVLLSGAAPKPVPPGELEKPRQGSSYSFSS